MVSSMVEAREGVVGWLVSRYFSGRGGECTKMGGVERRSEGKKRRGRGIFG